MAEKVEVIGDIYLGQAANKLMAMVLTEANVDDGPMTNEPVKIGKYLINQVNEGVFGIWFPLNEEAQGSNGTNVYLEFSDTDVFRVKDFDLKIGTPLSLAIFELVVEIEVLAESLLQKKLVKQRETTKLRAERLMKESSEEDPSVLLYNDVAERTNNVCDLLEALGVFESELLALARLGQQGEALVMNLGMNPEFQAWYYEISEVLAEMEDRLSKISVRDFLSRAVEIGIELTGTKKGLLVIPGLGGLLREEFALVWLKGELFDNFHLGITENSMQKVASGNIENFNPEKFININDNAAWMEFAALLVFMNTLRLSYKSYIEITIEEKEEGSFEALWKVHADHSENLGLALNAYASFRLDGSKSGSDFFQDKHYKKEVNRFDGVLRLWGQAIMKGDYARSNELSLECMSLVQNLQSFIKTKLAN